ncbi:Nad-dependent epimerase/dehydratase [Globisporangium polare]
MASPSSTATGGAVKKLFVFGLGFSAARAALAFRKKGFEVAGTSRTHESALQLAAQHPGVFHATDDDSEHKRNVFVFDGAQWDPLNDVSVEQALAGVTHMIISVPTGRSEGQEDPVLYALRDQLLASVSSSLQWLGYLSTIGVYGETHGIAVDESAPVQSSVKRSQMRIVAENQWLETGLPVHIFRIAGIYGPGRGTITKVRSGSATRIHIPGRMFNRIHVDDIVNILLASAAKPNSGAIYNVCDDEPAPADAVTAYACELLNVSMVPSQTWEEAEATMSAMAKTFYAESKITKNDRIKHELGVKLIYPSYREGLLAQLLEEEASSAEEAQRLLESEYSTVDTPGAKKKLVVLANIGSLRPEPYLDVRQLSFRLSRSLRLPVVPCSFRFSNRIDASKLHGIAAKTFEMVLNEHLQQYSEQSTEVVLLPLFFGNSSTLTDFLPDVLNKCWRNFTNDGAARVNRPPLSLRLGGCLVDMANPADDRVAQILMEKVKALTADVPRSEDISVLVLDHGTPNKEVHEARELVGDQLRKLLEGQVKLVGTGCMERREGSEYDFNDPLLEVALEHYKITSGVLVVAILFLSQGRHAGANGDIEEILEGVKEKHPNVEIRITEPLGTHELLSEVLQDRYYQVLSRPTPDFELTSLSSNIATE